MAERKSIEITAQQSEFGIVLTTIQKKEEVNLIIEPERVLNSKDLEAHFKKSLGIGLAATGLGALFGGLAAFGVGMVEPDGTGFVIDAAFFGSGLLMIYAGNILYEGGDLTRNQWQKLKEILGNTASRTNQTTNTQAKQE